IHIGVAGPATLKSLLSYARLCGIGASARLLRRQGANLAKLGMVSAPDRLIAGLARYRAEDQKCGVAQVHFFTFGGLRRSAVWLDAVRRGEIDWRADRNGFTARVEL
ncbi:MAG: metFprotein, partial [Inquilinus sp.]|nr:metFprotein [Inquilinus sp.]